MLYVIERAHLPRHVVVADQVRFIKPEFFAEPREKAHEGRARDIGKLPGGVRVADLDRDRIAVALVGAEPGRTG